MNGDYYMNEDKKKERETKSSVSALTVLSKKG